MYNEAIAGTDKRFKRRERSIDITRYSINAKPLKLSKSSKGKVKFAGFLKETALTSRKSRIFEYIPIESQ